jgi:hypothetical protein
MSLRRMHRPRRSIALVLISLGCAVSLASAAQARPHVGVGASKLAACKGANAKGIKLQVANIGCKRAYAEVYNGDQKLGKGCERRGSGRTTCHFRVSGFKCVYQESKNPGGVGVLVNATCRKTLKRAHRKVTQVVRWQFVFTG